MFGLISQIKHNVHAEMTDSAPFINCANSSAGMISLRIDIADSGGADSWVCTVHPSVNASHKCLRFLSTSSGVTTARPCSNAASISMNCASSLVSKARAMSVYVSTRGYFFVSRWRRNAFCSIPSYQFDSPFVSAAAAALMNAIIGRPCGLKRDMLREAEVRFMTV